MTKCSNTVPFTPLHDRVLVKVSKPENTTKGGIILSSGIKDKQKEGVVMAVGNGKDMTLKKGQRIVFPLHAGADIKIPGCDDEYLVMKETEIFGVLE